VKITNPVPVGHFSRLPWDWLYFSEGFIGQAQPFCVELLFMTPGFCGQLPTGTTSRPSYLMPENETLRMRTGALIRFVSLLAALSACAPAATAVTADLKSREQYQKSDDTRNVLVLHSSHRGYGWTDSIMEGVEGVMEAAMEAAPENIELWVEYLDASRLHSD
jgi:hypothetical protein